MKQPSKDPRGVKSRLKLQAAFQSLLEEQPFSKISVKAITDKANLARHTFYNHYETRIEILNSLIDSILIDFFTSMKTWSYDSLNPSKDLEMISGFFRIWQENPSLTALLNQPDLDDSILNRLEAFFSDFFYTKIRMEIPNVDEELAKYMIGFNTYSLLGLLKPWLKDGMKHSPETMAGFLISLCGSKARKNAVEKYKNIIR